MSDTSVKLLEALCYVIWTKVISDRSRPLQKPNHKIEVAANLDIQMNRLQNTKTKRTLSDLQKTFHKRNHAIANQLSMEVSGIIPKMKKESEGLFSDTAVYMLTNMS